MFVSSDLVSIQAGDEWYNKIMEALGATDVFIVVCSPTSLERPWVNLETGVAAFRHVRIIPVCHRGMIPGKLPQLLHRFQGIDISHPAMPTQLMTPIAGMLLQTPPVLASADILAAFQQASERSSAAGKNTSASSERSEGQPAKSAPPTAASRAPACARPSRQIYVIGQQQPMKSHIRQQRFAHPVFSI